jgi:hypothetical protein
MSLLIIQLVEWRQEVKVLLVKMENYETRLG